MKIGEKLCCQNLNAEDYELVTARVRKNAASFFEIIFSAGFDVNWVQLLLVC